MEMNSIQTFNVLYEILLLLFGILSIIVNLVLLICIWRATTKSNRNFGVFIHFFSLLEIISAVIMLVLQPRLISTDNIFFILLQGPMQFVDNTNYNNIIYKVYIALWYTRVVFFTFLLLYNTILAKKSIFSFSNAIIFVLISIAGSFVTFFIILQNCQIMYDFMANQAIRLGIDISVTNEAYSVSWLGTESCPLNFYAGYIVIAICVSWVPLIGVMWKINPMVVKKPKNLSKPFKKKTKSHFMMIIIWALSYFALALPSLCVYLFYRNNRGALSIYIDAAVYLFPLFTNISNPLIVISGTKTYRDYVKTLIFKISNKNHVLNVNNVITVNHVHPR